MYILTIKSGTAITRIQIGCMNEMALDMLCYADACGTFHSFTSVDAMCLPTRDEDELFRVESFIKLTREFAHQGQGWRGWRQRSVGILLPHPQAV